MKSIELGALWSKKDKNGNTYFSGTINVFPHGNVSVTIFANSYKTQDNQPDYKILYTPIGSDDSKGVVRNDSDIPF